MSLKKKPRPLLNKNEIIQAAMPKINAILEEIKSDIPTIEQLKDKKYRYKWSDRNLKRNIALQILVNRAYRGWSQKEFAKQINSYQACVSALENPNRRSWPNVKVLMRCARAFDCTLTIRFESWGTVYQDIIITADQAYVKSYNEVYPPSLVA